MTRYRISQKLFNAICQAKDSWKFLIDWFDPALAILHLDRIEFSAKRIYVYDAGINDVDNSFYLEACKSAELS